MGRRRCRNCQYNSGISPWCSDCIRAFIKGMLTAMGTGVGMWAVRKLAGLVLLLPLALAIVGSSCALRSPSLTQQIVAGAMKGLVWDADYTIMEGGDGAALASLYAHLAAMEITIYYLPQEDMPPGVVGRSEWTEEGDRFIKLRQNLSVNNTIEVLAHEGAHLFQPVHVSRSQADIFAHIVAAHVAKRLGVPNAAANASVWLKRHKPSLRTALDLEREIEFVTEILTPCAKHGGGSTRYARQ